MIERAGLSVSVVRVSGLEGRHRIDSEYYQPYFLEMARRLERFKLLADHHAQIMHPVEVKRVYEVKGLQLLFTQNIRGNYLDFTHTGFLPFDVEPQIRRNRLVPNDVVVTRTGANYGDAAVYEGSPDPIYASAHCLIIRTHEIPGAYLATYFNTKTGRALLKRGVYGAAQPEIAPDYIRTLRIPRDSAVEKIVEQKLTLATQRRADSERLYAEAQALLTAELGLDRLDLPTDGITTRRQSDLTMASRIDAEYFHPQKAFVQEWLSTIAGKTVGDHFRPIREIYNPPMQDTGKAILNFDLTDALNYFVDEEGPIVSECEMGSLKKWIRRDDVIVSRLRSYLKEIALVNVPKGVEAVGSSEFIVLRPSSSTVYPELLVVYLRSLPVQVILRWSQDGSNHPRFQERELLAIKLPDRALQLQEDIRRLIRSGIQAHQDAKRLLAEAKAEVERMIEEGAEASHHD